MPSSAQPDPHGRALSLLCWFLLAAVFAGALLLRLGRPVEAGAVLAPPDLSRRLSQQMDPNSAPARDLAALPGVGPALARRIVAYRQQHGGTGEEGGGGAVVFHGVQDLDEVKGIGPGALKRLAPYMRFPATQTAR